MIHQKRSGALSALGLLACSLTGCSTDNTPAIIDEHETLSAQVLADNVVTPDELLLIRPAMRHVLTELQTNETLYFVIEGVGHQLFVNETSVTGTIGKVKHIQFGGQDVTLFSLEGSPETQTITAYATLPLEVGQQVEVQGISIVFIDGIADFVSGIQPPQYFERYQKFVQLLLGDRPIDVLTIKTGDREVFKDVKRQQSWQEDQADKSQDRNWQFLLAQFS